MPFVEIVGFEKDVARRRQVARALTAGLAGAYAISPEIISLYFIVLDGESYAHAGHLDPGEAVERVFVKLHAFARDENMRAAAASAITDAVAEACGIKRKNVVVYFLERTPSEVAHDGILQSQR